MAKVRDIIIPKFDIYVPSHQGISVMAEMYTNWISEPKEKRKKVLEIPFDGIHKQFMNWLDCCYIDSGSYAVTNTAGGSGNIGHGSYMTCVGPSANTNYGPKLGTSATAIDITHYCLQGVIAHGTGAGQLSHGATTAGAPSTSGSSRSWTLTRAFTNGSGGTINVEECGIYCSYAGGAGYYMLVRDLTGTQAVLDTQVATLVYTWKATV